MRKRPQSHPASAMSENMDMRNKKLQYTHHVERLVRDEIVTMVLIPTPIGNGGVGQWICIYVPPSQAQCDK